ncbi:MAG: FecR family protein [Calditrichaceae bacterium]|jgi:hypothetical protein
MKKIITISLIGILIIPLIAGNLLDQPLGKITFFVGGIKLQNSGNPKWKNATFNSGVNEKDKIKTDKQSRCEISFSNKKVMRIGEKSIVEITKADAGQEEAKVEKGSFWMSLFLPWGQSSLKLKTPSSVCSIRGTVYRLDCDENHTTYRCYKGEIAVTPFKEDGETLSDSTFSIGAGEELILVMDFDEYKKQQEKAIQDYKKQQMEDFERFKQQDQQQFQEMLKKDEEDFKKINDMNYKKTTFNKEEDLKSDWVQWNMERDKLIQK